jgi:hypothetical protein
MNSAIFVFSSSGEGNGGGGVCSMLSRPKGRAKIYHGKIRVNLTLKHWIRSLISL